MASDRRIKKNCVVSPEQRARSAYPCIHSELKIIRRLEGCLAFKYRCNSYCSLYLRLKLCKLHSWCRGLRILFWAVTTKRHASHLVFFNSVSINFLGVLHMVVVAGDPQPSSSSNCEIGIHLFIAWIQYLQLVVGGGGAALRISSTGLTLSSVRAQVMYALHLFEVIHSCHSCQWEKLH